MSVPPPYRFRLRVSSRQPGKFAYQQNVVSVPISDSLHLEIAARNASTLDAATNYHIDGTGFPSRESARDAAEAVRVRLRLLNAVLGLGLNIPVEDQVNAQVSQVIKEKVRTEQGATVIDSVWGISVFPDDGLHFEYVISGDIVARPSDPSYIVEGLKMLWELPIALDEDSEVALQILSSSALETSEKAAFLTAYLALEQLVERQPRSEAARNVLLRFQAELNRIVSDESHPLTDAEAKSIAGVLGSLGTESLTTALIRLGQRISSPAQICDMAPAEFLSACVDTRNKLAHRGELRGGVPLEKLTKALREFVITLIWTRNKLPPFSLNTPASQVSIAEGGMTIRVM